MKTRLVVLVSGSGSNLQAIMDACASGRLHAEVVAVLSNRRAAYGLERARLAGITHDCVPLGAWLRAGGDRPGYDADLARRVGAWQPDLVVLAGWMHIVTSHFLDPFVGRVLNLHPALPGAFPGTDAIARALRAFERGEIPHTGVMVHHVTPEVDAGPVVATAVVPIEKDDDLPSLTARVHAVEHTLLVQAIAQLVRSLPAAAETPEIQTCEEIL